MANIISISIPEADLELYKEFVQMRWKEKKNISEMIVLAMKEYYKNHSRAENQPTLDPFQDKDFRACPAFFAPFQIINEYQSSLKGSSKQEFFNKFCEWHHLAKKNRIIV